MNRRVLIAAATTGALVLGVPTAASATAWWGWDGHHHRHHAPPTAPPTSDPTDPDTLTPSPAPSESSAPEPSETTDPVPTETPTETPTQDPAPAPADEPTATPTPEPAQVDEAATAASPPDSSFVEQFSAGAALGQVASAYAQSWQPYPDGTSGIYAPSRTVTAHDGVLDVALGTGAGAAGTFGTKAGAWDHVGGSFSVRARATGGDGNGAAFILWPTSNRWADGEIDFPEGNFEASPSAFQHSMTPGREAERVQVPSGVSWRDWHTYTVDWDPGRSVTYKVDGQVLHTVTQDVPTTPHRFMFQVGNWGASGHLLIDWVSTTE